MLTILHGLTLALLLGNELASKDAMAPGKSILVGFAIVGSYLPQGLAIGARYVPKWKKQACEIPASQHPNSHYVCDEAGEVKCLPGWAGDLCDVPICRKGCDPLQGYCRRPGECRCKLGFYGEFCEKCVALPGCQHGRCNVSFECACDPGWKGLFCNEPVCASDCNPNQGYCDKPGECKCRLGWQGPMCKQCSVLPGCEHGTCLGPLECRCEPGWTGFLCSTPICSHGCSREHGTCRKPNTCRCRVGWTGKNCTECVPYPGCDHGSCRKPWECRCSAGWTGDLCNERLTFCEDNKDVCKNSATCISVTKEQGNYRCICPPGFYGRQCEKQMEMPATDLIPPRPDNKPSSNDSSKPTTVATPVVIVNATSIGGSLKKGNTTATTGKLPVNTVTPASVVTSSPSTVDPAATAGKWPPEPPTDSPLSQIDSDNET